MTLIYDVQTLWAKEETLSGESEEATKGQRHKSKEQKWAPERNRPGSHRECTYVTLRDSNSDVRRVGPGFSRVGFDTDYE